MTDKIKNIIKTFDYFNELSDEAVIECAKHATIKTYNKNEIVLGDDQTKMMNFVHFVYTGKCILIEQQFLDKNNKLLIDVDKKTNCKDKPKLHRFYTNNLILNKILQQKEIWSKIRNNEDIKIVFVEVCSFNPKSCFNLGESLKNRRIIATELTKCVLIPQYWFKNCKDLFWTYLFTYYSKYIPKSLKIYQIYKRQRKFRDYTKKLFYKFKKNLKPVNTVNNIPYSIRIEYDLK